LAEADKIVGGEQKTLADLMAVDTEQIELPGFVPTIDQPVPPASSCVQTTDNDVTTASSKLALHTVEQRPKIDDQVIPFVVKRPRHADCSCRAFVRDGRFGEQPQLVRRQHRQQRYRRSERLSAVALGRGCFDRLLRDVVPQLLEAVVRPRLGREDVQHDVAEVADDPRRLALAVGGPR